MILTIIIGSICDINVSNDFISTIYQVSGIIFSIGMGLIVSFNITSVKNRTYIKKIRDNIKHIQNIFMIYFAITTILFCCFYIKTEPLVIISKYKVIFNIQLFITLSIICSIIYFILNFMKIQELNSQIFDRINEELENK